MLKFLKEKRRFIGKVLKWVGTGVRDLFLIRYILQQFYFYYPEFFAKRSGRAERRVYRRTVDHELEHEA